MTVASDAPTHPLSVRPAGVMLVQAYSADPKQAGLDSTA